MNNHHDIVYVPNEKGTHYVSELGTGTGVKTGRLIKPLKDVFVFTKEELDKRDEELLQQKQKIKSERNVKQPCEGCSTDCYNWQIGDCRS